MKLSSVFKSLALLFLSGGVAFGATNAKVDGGLAVIQGQWIRINQMSFSPVKELFVFRMDDGVLKKLASCEVGEDKAFSFAISPEKQGDFYYIGVDKLPQGDRCIFFLKPGDRLDFTVNDSTYVLNGDKNSPENIEMTKWHNFVYPLERKSLFMLQNMRSTYKDFNPQLDAMLTKIKNYPKAKTPNRYFNRAFEGFKRANLLEITMEYHFRPHAVHADKAENYGEYYRQLSIPEITKGTDLYRYNGGMNILNHACEIRYIIENNARMQGGNYLIEQLEKMPNDTIKGEWLLHMARTKTTYDELADLEAQYGKYLLTKNQQARFLTMKNGKTKAGDNKPAPNFVATDLEGKEVKLSDFLGKVVYIDVWATWCGPCLREIPALKQIEEEYTPKGVVFISLSVDANKDKETWKNMVAEKELKGVQLFAGERTSKEVYDNYFITGIPRFIAINKDGTIAEMTAPRPSATDAIKKMLDKLLK